MSSALLSSLPDPTPGRYSTHKVLNKAKPATGFKAFTGDAVSHHENANHALERDDRPRATSVDDAVNIRRETPAPLKKPFEIFGRRGSTNRPKTSPTTVSKTHRRQGSEIARKSGPS